MTQHRRTHFYQYFQKENLEEEQNNRPLSLQSLSMILYFIFFSSIKFKNLRICKYWPEYRDISLGGGLKIQTVRSCFV